MKAKSYSFIDLSRLGRTEWWASVLTVLFIAIVGILLNLGFGIALGGSIYMRNLHFATVIGNGVPGATDAIVAILGFWLACKFVLLRPFSSLISTDLKFRIRRCLFGAALYLLLHFITIAAVSTFLSMRAGVWLIPFRHFVWPHADKVFVTLLTIVTIPFLAFSEELFFRGWLTQTLRQYVRFPVAVVVIVAVVFAAYHRQYDFHGKIEIFAASLGYSVLSLRDQRLELSIGAHTMLNICVALHNLFFPGPFFTHIASVPSHITFGPLDWFALAAIKGALPFALMYWSLQKTKGWFTPHRATKVADAQPA
jgi:uncharacterized protein